MSFLMNTLSVALGVALFVAASDLYTLSRTWVARRKLRQALPDLERQVVAHSETERAKMADELARSGISEEEREAMLKLRDGIAKALIDVTIREAREAAGVKAK